MFTLGTRSVLWFVVHFIVVILSELIKVIIKSTLNIKYKWNDDARKNKLFVDLMMLMT